MLADCSLLTASPAAQLENESKLTVSIILGEEIS